MVIEDAALLNRRVTLMTPAALFSRRLQKMMRKLPSRKSIALHNAIADASRSSGINESVTPKPKVRLGCIMYIECKGGKLTGTARIGRVTLSKTGRTLRYGGLTFQSLKGAGFKSNYYAVETGDDYWISGPKRRGGDRLYGSVLPIEIDEDVRAEYWRDIRSQPEKINEATA